MTTIDHLKELFEERAAIKPFDGKMTREEAERRFSMKRSTVVVLSLVAVAVLLIVAGPWIWCCVTSW